MDEATWLTCTELGPMLEYLGPGASDRKLRLLACASTRRIWHCLEDERVHQAVLVAEAFADGLASQADLDQATWTLGRAHIEGRQRLNLAWAGYWMRPAYQAVLLALQGAAQAALFHVRTAVEWPNGNVELGRGVDAFLREHFGMSLADVGGAEAVSLPAGEVERDAAAAEQEGVAQAQRVRDLFGNPFRPVSLDPAWLTPAVVSLVQAAYEERNLPSGHLDNARLLVLADALEEAGCLDPDIIGHLHGPGPHYRGCHVVDQLLGKV